MMRRASVLGLLTLLVSPFVSSLPVNAQCPPTSATLASIAVTAPGLFESLFRPGVFGIQSGSFAGLVATGTFSDGSMCVLSNVTWSSSDPTLISVSPSGLATALVPSLVLNVIVDITASSGAITSTPFQLTIIPQTALYATDGSTVGIWNITLGGSLPPTSTLDEISYHTALGGGNGASPVPMVLTTESNSFGPQQGSTLTLLFVGNPGYQSNNTGDFTVSVINTATHAVKTTITASDGLCYPTSLALKGNLLFVVNAGPAVFQATSGTTTPATCSAATAPNVEVFDVSGLYNSNVNGGTFKLVTTLSAASLASSSAIPIVAAASIDPNDPFVYVGSTANYNNLCNNSCAGTLTQISTNTLPPSVATQTSLSFSSNTKGYSISPLGLAVATAYPSSAAQPTHTVFVVGPGFNTLNPPANNPPSTNGMYFWQFPDQCPNSPNATCSVTSPSLIFLESGPSYVPIPIAAAPDGLTVFAGDGGFFLDSFVSPDGSFFSIANFFSTGRGTSCTVSTCLPITSIATTADNQTVYPSFSSASDSEIERLSSSSLAGGAISEGGPILGLTISQSPEISAVITSQVGTQVTVNYTAHGNFQEQQNQTLFSETLTFNQTPLAHMGGPITNPSDFPLPGLIGDTTGSSGTLNHQVTAPNTVTNQNGLNSNGFIGTSPVGPISIAFQTTSPASVSVARTFQFSVTILNAIPDTVTLTATLGSLSLSSTSPGTVGTPLASVPSGATVFYFAPTTINPNPSSVTITATADVANCSSGTGNQCSAPFLLQIVAPTASFSTNSVTFSGQLEGTASGPQNINLTNTGSATLTISGVTITGNNAADFTISQNTCPSNLGVGAPFCTISVSFAPTTGAQTSRSAQLSISDNASDSPQIVALSGTAILPPQVTLSQIMPFGNQVVATKSSAQPVTLTNTGGSALTITGFSFTGLNPGDFGQTNNCTSTVSAGGTCTINITFTPAATGTRSATLNIADNATNSPQSILLSGNGISTQTPPQVTLSQIVPFGNQVVATKSSAQPVTLTNTGGSALTITGFSFTGLNLGDFGQTNNCTTTVSAGGTCTINITFTPAATGTRSATLNIADNAANSPQTINVSGTGVPITVTISPSNPQPIPTVTGGSIHFSATVQGSANQVVTWSLTGTGCSGVACGTIDSTGLYTAPAALPTTQPVVDTVVAKPQADPTQSALVTVSVSLANPVSVAVTPATDTLDLSSTVQFNAKVQSVTNQSVTWQVNSVTGGGSTLGTINTSGLYTAPATLPNSNPITITAISVADPTKSGTATVTLRTPVSVSLSPASADVEVGVGNSQVFTATVLPASASPNVTWSLSGTGCAGASCGTLSNVTAATATYAPSSNVTSASVVLLTAKSVADGSKSASASINVYLKPLLSTSAQSATVTPGQPATYNLSLSPGTGDPAKPFTIQCDPRFLPSGVGCPAQIIQPSKTGVNFTLTLTTTGLLSAALISPISRTMIVASFGLVFPVGMLMFFKGRRDIPLGHRWGTFLVALFLISACLVSMNGCATNGSFGQPSPKNFNVTPNGTFTIHVDGVGPSGVPEEIGQVTLIVN